MLEVSCSLSRRTKEKVMRIYTRAGDMSFELFTFPDGQPHLKLLTDPVDDSFHEATIETAIRNPMELFTTLLAKDVLANNGYKVNLDIRYLMGARMDRRIGDEHPFTLSQVANVLLCGGNQFNNFRILDCHSNVALGMLEAENVLPEQVVRDVLNQLPPQRIIIPDMGATERVTELSHHYLGWHKSIAVQCVKHRDMQTGKLTGFEVKQPTAVRGKECLIIDDICDGGGTFIGLAEALREAGATKVRLFVTHGIFSKGLPLKGIDRVFTTNSYHETKEDWREWQSRHHSMLSQDILDSLTVIPISMKELK